MLEKPFKTCANCSKVWGSTDEFLEDKENILLGYQVNFDDLPSGLFFFVHTSCFNGLSFHVQDFSHLRNGPVFTENKAGTESCPGHCLHNKRFDPCENTCECRWVREVMQVIRGWKKKPALQS